MKSTQTDYMIYGAISKDEGEYAVSLNLISRKGENATVIATATQFSTSLGVKALTIMAANAVKQLHGQKVEKNDTIIIDSQTVGNVSFIVITDPPGAFLTINNAKKGTTPKKLQYPEGTFNGKLTCPGFLSKEFTIDLPAQTEYKFTLVREKYPLTFKLGAGMPNGIVVSEGGKYLGSIIDAGGLTLDLDSGEHLLTFTKRGYDEKQTAINHTKAATFTVSLKRSEYTLSVHANTSAKVYVDGKLLGGAPVERKLFFGHYVVKLEADGYLPEEKNILLEKNTTLQFALQKRAFVPFRVTSKHEGADVYFGGKKQGTAPGTFQWPEGGIGGEGMIR